MHAIPGNRSTSNKYLRWQAQFFAILHDLSGIGREQFWNLLGVAWHIGTHVCNTRFETIVLVLFGGQDGY